MQQQRAIVVCAGVGGLIGQPLVRKLLATNRYRLRVLYRSTPPKFIDQASSNHIDLFQWDATSSAAPPANVFDGASHVINLTGENIAAKWLTDARVKAVTDSRLQSTRQLASAAAEYGLKSMVNASAIGFYGGGDGAQPPQREEGGVAGTLPLSKMVQQWEEAAKVASDRNVRVVRLRFGLVLHGLLSQLPPWPVPITPLISTTLPAPWVHLDDVVNVIVAALENDAWNGPVNVVAPSSEQCTMDDLLREYASAKNRLYLPLPVPYGVLRLLAGPIAELIADTPRVSAHRLVNEWHYEFKYPQLADAVRNTKL